MDQIVKEKYVLLRMLVSDIDKALEFYVNRLALFEICWDSQLNFRPSLPEDRQAVALFSKNGTMFGIHFITYLQSLPSNCPVSDWPLLFLPVEDIDLVRKVLNEHGIQLFNEVDLPFQASLQVIDPFGNKIAIVETYLDRD